MALHILIKREGDELIVDEAKWEDGRDWTLAKTHIPLSGYPNMTSAEAVEFWMLENGMVASWPWSEQYSHGERYLVGQFVYAADHNGKAYKEVSDSRAHRFNLEATS